MRSKSRWFLVIRGVWVDNAVAVIAASGNLTFETRRIPAAILAVARSNGTDVKFSWRNSSVAWRSSAVHPENERS
jgi:hypothetical protein